MNILGWWLMLLLPLDGVFGCVVVALPVIVGGLKQEKKKVMSDDSNKVQQIQT